MTGLLTDWFTAVGAVGLSTETHFVHQTDGYSHGISGEDSFSFQLHGSPPPTPELLAFAQHLNKVGVDWTDSRLRRVYESLIRCFWCEFRGKDCLKHSLYTKLKLPASPSVCHSGQILITSYTGGRKYCYCQHTYRTHAF